MEITISFKLKLDDTSYNVNTKNDLALTIVNIGDWLRELHLANIEKRIVCEFDSGFLHEPGNEESLAAAIKSYDEDKKLSAQIFDNYSVSGIMEDGTTFECSQDRSKMTGYTLINGVEEKI